LKIGFEIDVLEAAIEPEREEFEMIRQLMGAMSEHRVQGVVTEIILVQIDKFAKYRKKLIGQLMDKCQFERIHTNEKSDRLAEDYLMHGVIDRKNRRRARNIAAFAFHQTPIYIALNYHALGKYVSRKKILRLNQKRKIDPIDLGSPAHAEQILRHPHYVGVIHRAQEEVYMEQAEISSEEEIVKTRRRARRILTEKS